MIANVSFDENELSDYLTWSLSVKGKPGKKITAKISSGQCCCETYGIHIEDLAESSLKGSMYDHVVVHYNGDNCLGGLGLDFSGYKGPVIRDEVACDAAEWHIAIKVHTNNGVATIGLYNHHDGYYEHDIYIKTEHGVIKGSL